MLIRWIWIVNQRWTRLVAFTGCLGTAKTPSMNSDSSLPFRHGLSECFDSARHFNELA